MRSEDIGGLRLRDSSCAQDRQYQVCGRLVPDELGSHDAQGICAHLLAVCMPVCIQDFRWEKAATRVQTASLLDALLNRSQRQ